MWGEMRMNPTDLVDVGGATYTYLMNGATPTANWTAPFSRGERVRLRFGNGIELDDDVECGWALFFTDRPVERPEAVVELLDATGTAVASHQWPAGPGLPDALRRRIPLVLTRRV